MPVDRHCQYCGEEIDERLMRDPAFTYCTCGEPITAAIPDDKKERPEPSFSTLQIIFAPIMVALYVFLVPATWIFTIIGGVFFAQMVHSILDIDEYTISDLFVIMCLSLVTFKSTLMLMTLL